MTSKDQDTDPSTPGALRGLAPTDPTPTPIGASAHVSTDPGVGPPSVPPFAVTQPLQAPRRSTPPIGIVVPATSPVKPRKDSVELLLDGMQGPQPERPKTMPQTDGQSSASYHAEHMVRPATTSPDEVPKVVVERPLQAPTTRIDRGRVQAVIDAADARRRANEATAVLPQQIAPRVIVAVIAGITVVLGLFVVLRLTLANHGSTETPSPTHALAPAPTLAPTPTPMPAPTLAPAPPPTPADLATATASPPDTATAAPRPATTPAWPTAPAPTKPKPPRPASPPSSDLGEFKTTLH